MSDRLLYVVATPIGNLSDVTYRAIEVLKSVDVVYCEDTRQTRKLLDRYQISVRCRSLHQHTEDPIIEAALREFPGSAALVTDAGTPTISDPGWKVVATARRLGISVRVVPGPDAVTAALSVSGLPVSSYTFFGFIPHKKGRQTFLSHLLQHDRLAVCYESPHRIMKTLEWLFEQESQRLIVVIRELTKIHEEVLSGTIEEVYHDFASRDIVKGEFVLLVPPE